MRWGESGRSWAIEVDSNPYQSPHSAQVVLGTGDVWPARGGWRWVLVAVLLAALLWLVPFLNFLPLVFLGWAASRAWPQAARMASCSQPLIAGAILGVLIPSGLLPDRVSTVDVHRWSGHGLLIFQYVSVPFSLGVLIHQKLMQRPVIAGLQSLMLLLCLAVSFSASFTGYLDVEPGPDPVIAKENHNRFVVLHMFLLPMILAATLTIWHFAFWPRPRAR